MSTIRVDNFGPSAGGTTYSARGIAKAWVNFDGTGTIAARDSENVSSLTDNGTGNYTVNFSSSMDNANYSCVVSGGEGSGTPSEVDVRAPTGSTFSTSNFQMRSSNGSALIDAQYLFANTHGDLA